MTAPTRGSEPSALDRRLETAGLTASRRPLSAAAAHDLGLPGSADWIRPLDQGALRRALRALGDGAVPTTVVGGASALGFGGPLRPPAALLSLELLETPIDHSVADFVVTAGAGLRLAALQERLREHGQWIPVEVPDPELATLGGAVGAAATSLLAASHGTLRHAVLGTTAVLSDGVVAHAGGRVVKNVSGYDWNKLVHGAAGTLGVIRELTLRARPLPAEDRTLAIRCADLPSAFALVPALRAIRQEPAAVWAHAADGGTEVLVRLLGARSAVERQEREVRAALGDRGVAVVDGSEGRRERWRAVLEGLSRGADPGTLQLSLLGLPSGSAALVRALDALAGNFEPAGARASVVADLLRAVIWWKCVPGPCSAHDSAARCDAFLREVDGRVVRWQVHAAPATERAAFAARRVSPKGHAELARRLSEAFDPAFVLSPGRHGVER